MPLVDDQMYTSIVTEGAAVTLIRHADVDTPVAC